MNLTNPELFWNAPVEGWWVQVTWVALVALWTLHTLLRVIHMGISWPHDRSWKFWWIIASAAEVAYFFAQVYLTHEPRLIPVWLMTRNMAMLLLVITLILDVSQGIKGTAARRGVGPCRKPGREG